MPDKKLWNRHLAALAPYAPGYQPPPTADMVKLNTNENPYPPSPHALEAIREAAGERLRLYPRSSWEELRDVIAGVYRVPSARVFCANGSDETLTLVFRCFTEPGDRVTFPDPTYSLYEVLAAMNGVDCTRVQTGDDFAVELAALPVAGHRVAFLANPNAPTGLLVPHAQIADFARRFDGLLVVDEAYIDFTDDPDASTALPLVAEHDNLLVTRTCSKSFSLCGLRVGYAFGHEDLVAALVAGKDSYNLDALAQAGAAAAIADQAWMKANAARVRATRARAVERLAGLGFATLPSQGNFLFARHATRGGRALHDALAASHVYVRHFDKPRLADWLRITIGTDDEMDRLYEVLAAILAGP